MEQLFTTLTNAVEGSAVIAIFASFIWGVLSIILSPCHLASIPLIVGFISEQKELTVRRAFWTASLFSLGILVTIGVIGILTSAAGRMAGDLGDWGNYIVAGIFFIVGLHLLGVIPLPFSGPGQVSMQRKGMLAAFMLGLIFGIALGPCTFAFMAPVLAVTFRVAAAEPVYAATLLLAYGVGHCSIIIAAGTFTEVVEKYMHWNDSSPAMRVIKNICGVLVLLGGLYLIYKT